ncbi:uncharacterized protein G6M90_00g111500 [Metarhizium brunneum]|uniref:Vegetative incompatibility protein HET-E-1 n=1 Tax=Metarhizium brunneum TaxID=500148 RepID=A0A7D5V4E1_9HYPO|nr:hypothetical protein G6M90_00g111500 [Metarhizium brunneum]
MHDYIAAKVRDLARTNKYDEELEEQVIRQLHLASQVNYLWLLRREVNCLLDQPGIVHAVYFSDDGSKLAAAISRAASIWDLDCEMSASSTFKNYDIENTATSTVKSVVFCKNRKLLATGSTDFEVKVWDVSFIWDVEMWKWRRTVGRRILVNWKQQMSIRNLEKESLRDLDRIERSQSHPGTETTKLREPLHRLKGHTGAIDSLVFSCKLRHIASGSKDSTVRIWELNTEEPEARKPPDARRGAVNSVALAAYKNGYRLASCTERDVDIWDFGTGEHLQVMRSPCRILCGGLAASPNGAYLATGSYEGTVDLWHAPRKRIEQEPEPAGWVEPRSPINKALSPDGRTLAVSQVGENILLWDIETNELVNPRI